MNHCGRPTCQCYEKKACCEKCEKDGYEEIDCAICPCHQADTSVQGERASFFGQNIRAAIQTIKDAAAPDTREWEQSFDAEFEHSDTCYLQRREEEWPRSCYCELKDIKSFITTLLLAERVDAGQMGANEGVLIGIAQERTRIEEALEAMKPILWNDDPIKHVRNIERAETLDAVLKIIWGD